MVSNGFILDYNKCVGCHACIVACYNENKTQPPISWRQINSFNKKKIPLAGAINLSIACNHCVDAPCMKACPAKAYSRDKDSGAVLHNPDKCIGCRFCTWACPFDAPKYNKEKGVIEKCNLCNQRLIEGKVPSCANNCPTGALTYDTINIADATEQIGIPKTKFEPKIKTLNTELVNNPPLLSTEVSGFEIDKFSIEETDQKINALEEWPLAIFTFIFAFLAGWFTSFSEGISFVSKFIFLFLGITGLLLSSFHLGKPLRAYRSVMNVETSWLSREILFCGLYFFFSLIYLFFVKSIILFYISAFLGLILVGMIEGVYLITKRKIFLHSSNTILTALLFSAYFNGAGKLMVLLIVIKAILYIKQKGESNISYYSPINLIFRIIIGIIMPLGIVCFALPAHQLALLICLLIGEIIDRFEYYNSLHVITPKGVLDSILENKLLQGRF